jgi:hypothetical protein
MDEHERVHASCGDEPRGNDGLAESRGGGQHAGVVPQHRPGGRLLLRAKVAAEGDLERTAARALVPDGHANAQRVKRLPNVFEAAAR